MENYVCGFNQSERGKYFEFMSNDGYYFIARDYFSVVVLV